MNLGPSALQRTSAWLRNSACLCRRSIAGRAALLARQRCPASRWRVVLGLPTPTVGLLLVPAGTVFRLAFLASLRDALVWPVAVLHWYDGTVRLLPGVHVRLVVIGLPGPVCSRRRDGDLPVLVHVVSRRAGVFDYAGPDVSSRLALLASVAFPLTEKGRRPDLRFRSSIAQHTDASVYASPAASRRPAQDSRSGWSRFSFPVGLFHPLQHAGLSRRTLSPSVPSVPHRPRPHRSPSVLGCGNRSSRWASSPWQK